ncbi:MAG TPA: hypothetical protein VFE84_08730 [Patescibacteria group bacterium]|nr:hypothetical protein [Patescibacteria group bacterium]
MPREADIEPLPSEAAGAPRWAEGLEWLAALAAVRILVMLGIGWLTGGRHFTDDWVFELGFIKDPFQILMSREGEGAPYQPPLAPFMSFLFGAPFVGLLPSFYAIRCFSILGELAAWPIVWRLLTTAVGSIRTQRLLALTYVLMPVGWATTSLFAEEEPIAMLCFAAIMLLVLKGRIKWAILLASIGVVTAKVYFLIPLLALTAGPKPGSLKEWLRRLALAVGPIALVYGIVQFSLWQQHRASPLMEFTPHGIHSTSIWVLIRAWLDLSLESTKHLSMLTGFLTGITPLVVARVRRIPCEGMTLVRIMTAMILFVFMWFYHCDPEYYLIVTPGILICFPPVAAVLIAVVGLAIPYAINLFYGVAMAREAATEEGKTVIVHLYDRFVHWDPDTWHTISLLALCALSLTITLWLTLQVARAPRSVRPIRRAGGASGRS